MNRLTEQDPTWREYENTGLTPTEVAELAQAKKDGQFVVLPCKVGDLLYTNMQFSGSYLRRKDRPYPVEVVFIGLNSDIDTRCGFINTTYLTGHMRQFMFSDIGKTVFLTKSEANESRRGDGFTTFPGLL